MFFLSELSKDFEIWKYPTKFWSTERNIKFYSFDCPTKTASYLVQFVMRSSWQQTWSCFLIIFNGILVVSGFALFFALFHICPIFCPHFLPLPLPSFFVEGKGEGKKWGQNIGQMWKRAKLKAKLEGKNIRGRGQNTGQKCEFIWNNSWAPKTPNIKTTELIWTDCTFPTFIWSLLSLFKFEKKNARQWNWVEKIENLQKCFWWSVKLKISKFPIDTV